MLADKLNMSPEEAERWIVNLIRNARLDAKIDSKLVRGSLLIFIYSVSNSLECCLECLVFFSHPSLSLMLVVPVYQNMSHVSF